MKRPPKLIMIPAVLSFAHDVIICGIPAALIVSAVVKGMLSFIVLKLVLDKLSSFLGIDKIDGSSDILRMNGKLLSGIYFGIVAVYAVIGLMVFWCACFLLMFLHYRCWRSTCSGVKNGGMPKRVELHKRTVFDGLIFTN